jgi:hypothetical protein
LDDLFIGGWHLGPAKKVPLPRVTLTKQQLKENAAAQKAHDKLCAALDAIAEKIEKLGGQVGYDGEGIGYPPLELPHDPEALDKTKFGDKEWAYFDWLETQSKPALIKLKSFGIGLKYMPSMMMSVGDLSEDYGPPKLPNWAKVTQGGLNEMVHTTERITHVVSMILNEAHAQEAVGHINADERVGIKVGALAVLGMLGISYKFLPAESKKNHEHDGSN